MAETTDDLEGGLFVGIAGERTPYVESELYDGECGHKVWLSKPLIVTVENMRAKGLPTTIWCDDHVPPEVIASEELAMTQHQRETLIATMGEEMFEFIRSELGIKVIDDA